MSKVICKLPNASELISGVKFVSHKDGMISEDISDDVASAFLEVPGFEPALTPAQAKAAEKAAAAEKETADAEAKALAEKAAQDAQAEADALAAAEKAKLEAAGGANK